MLLNPWFGCSLYILAYFGLKTDFFYYIYGTKVNCLRKCWLETFDQTTFGCVPSVGVSFKVLPVDGSTSLDLGTAQGTTDDINKDDITTIMPNENI